MDRILPRLYLGSLEDGIAAGAPITRILNLREESYDSAIIVLHRPIPDEVWLPAEIWQGLVSELDELLRHSHTVLVHCRLGVSRSPSLAAAYLTHAGYERHLHEAVRYVMQQRDVVKIHPETMRGVTEWWEGRKNEQ